MSTDAGRPGVGGHAGDHIADHIDDHIEIDELADDAEGLLDPDRTAEIAAHLADCQQCSSNAAALTQVQDLLAGAPAVAMPDGVFARLQDTIAAEQQLREAESARHRTGDHTGPAAPIIGTGRPPYVDQHGHPSAQGGGRFPKPHIAEHFTETKLGRRGLRARFAAGAAGAALLASTAGFGSYVLSASAGANEPPADQPIVAANAQSLASSAARAASGDLDSYRFSKAWQCAREATNGSITGILTTVLGGQHGYLVFLRTNSGHEAVFVSGCDTGTPTAGPTVKVDR